MGVLLSQNESMCIMSLESSITDYVDTGLNSVSNDTIIVDAGRKMIELGVDSVLVSKDNMFSGIVTQTDIMKAISNEVRVSDSVESIMSAPLSQLPAPQKRTGN
jgi:signal-transduction protein with cAMP-binding, CBS, and nucleotidyltransferase domain